MQIPIQLIEPLHTLKAVATRALIDSGASISCLDWEFVQKHSLPTTQLQKPIYARNTDNSINSKGVICFTSTLFLNIKGIARKVTFHIVSLGNENVHVNAITDSRLFEYNGWEEESQFLARMDTNRTLHQIIRCGSRFLYRGSPLEEKISKITTTTELATTAEKAKPKQTLPPEFTNYTSVFSKEATDHVLPSRPYDHEINLNDSFTLKIGKVYPLSPEEQKATKDFLQKTSIVERSAP